MKILICEEDLETQKYMAKHLGDLGHECVMTASGKDAVKEFQEQEPDLVIIDFDVSDMGGIETTNQINASCYDFSQWIPIMIMCTPKNDESGSDQKVIDALNAGADDFLIKPLSYELLKAKINSIRRIVSLRENLIDFGNQLREVNDKLLASNQLLSELSLRDPLTLLANRRAFEETLERARRLARRNQTALSLIMIDVDHFKPYNDTYGHQAGDVCLKQVAQAIKGSLHRDKDVAARYGGEEFSVILPETDNECACKIGERIRLAVENLQLKNIGSPRGFVSVSMGVASTQYGVDFITESLVAAGDDALYQAKDQGRNKVVAATKPVDAEKPKQHISSYKTGAYRTDDENLSKSKNAPRSE